VNWPDQCGPLCETNVPTLVFYPSDSSDAAPSFGWTALQKIHRAPASVAPWSRQSHLKSRLNDVSANSAESLPPGKTIVDVMADYIRYLSRFIFRFLAEADGQIAAIRGNQELQPCEVQWIVTVPHSWGLVSRNHLLLACQLAELSVHHPVRIVTELDAVASHAKHKLNSTFVNDRLSNLFIML
jgi:hypothetical protein